MGDPVACPADGAPPAPADPAVEGDYLPGQRLVSVTQTPFAQPAVMERVMTGRSFVFSVCDLHRRAVSQREVPPRARPRCAGAGAGPRCHV
jgi:hypothetical protein